MEAVRIIKEMRRSTNGQYPRYCIWENVPGAFSSNAGEDFRTVLEEIIKISEPTAPPLPPPDKGRWPYADVIVGEGWSVAYRTFDAQYWGRTVLDRDSGHVLQMGTPQRRRRIYLVADFTGQSAGEILFKPTRLHGNPPPLGEEGQETASDAQGGAGTADSKRDAIAFTANQRDEVRNLGARSAALQARPGMKQQTFIIDNIGGQAEYGKDSPVNGTIRAGRQGAIAYSVENHPNDSRVNIDESGKCQTLTSRMGTGGGNVPMVMEAFSKSGRPQSAEHATTWKHGTVANTLNTFDTGESRANELVVETIALEGNGQRPSHRGDGYAVTDKSYTLNTTEVHGVAYGISSYDSNAMKSSNPHSGIYEATTSRTLDLNGGSPACNQGGIAIVEERPAYSMETFHCVSCEEKTATLKARDYKDPNVVCYGLDRASFNQGANAQFGFSVLPEQQPTLTAKGPGAVCSRYIVRRLTPTECARLQGFPDTWGHPPQKDSLTDEEYAFWQKVRNTHAEINGRNPKEYSKKQILTWYNKLHTDSSEYKMWGNGLALPNARFIMSGIAEQLQKAREDEYT